LPRHPDGPAGLYGHERCPAVTALRSLFTWAKKTGVIFRNPAPWIRLGEREHPIWQPLTAVHTARPGAIRALQLDDADLDGRRLHLAAAGR
jgi:hypothetical protein